MKTQVIHTKARKFLAHDWRATDPSYLRGFGLVEDTAMVSGALDIEEFRSPANRAGRFYEGAIPLCGRKASQRMASEIFWTRLITLRDL